jgi:hypothetical protein
MRGEIVTGLYKKMQTPGFPPMAFSSALSPATFTTSHGKRGSEAKTLHRL